MTELGRPSFRFAIYSTSVLVVFVTLCLTLWSGQQCDLSRLRAALARSSSPVADTQRLARTQECGEAIIIGMGSDIWWRIGTPPEEMQDRLEGFEVAVLVNAMECVTASSNRQCLLVAIGLVDDGRRGRYSYSTRRLGIITARGSAECGPVSVAAQRLLIRSLGCDHGGDKEAWRVSLDGALPLQ